MENHKYSLVIKSRNGLMRASVHQWVTMAEGMAFGRMAKANVGAKRERNKFKDFCHFCAQVIVCQAYHNPGFFGINLEEDSKDKHKVMLYFI